MVGLRTARVIVIDDEEVDGLEIVRALWRKRVAPLYFRDAKDVPAQPDRLLGVRLAFLDMNMVGGVPDKSKVSALVNLLKQILSPRNGPFLAVAWTQHRELVPAFDAYLFQQDMPRPISIVTIAKADCKTPDGKAFDLNKVSGAIDRELANFSPLLFLQAWEEACFQAATAVTSELSNLASSTESDPDNWRLQWRTELLRLIYALAVAQAGKKNLQDGNAALCAFLNALNPLTADRLETQSPKLSQLLGASSPEIVQPEAAKATTGSAKARINTMLHCSFERLGTFYAGNVYDDRIAKIIPNVDEFLGSYVVGDRSSGEWKDNVASIRRDSVPVLVEANTSCDHDQKKVRLARCIGGYLVPRTEMEKDRGQRRIKKADYLWELGPIAIPIDGTVREFYLVLNALFVISSEPDRIQKRDASFRLRSQAFADVQSWFGHHASRPGITLLRVEN